MTTLSIDPTDDDILAWLAGGEEASAMDLIRAAHQAGIEAERARAASELAEANDDPHVAALQYQAGWEAGIEAERRRAATEAELRRVGA